MKNWFEKLPAIAQVTIIIIGLAFFIAVIDVATRLPFIDLIKTTVGTIWQNGQWLQ